MELTSAPGVVADVSAAVVGSVAGEGTAVAASPWFRDERVSAVLLQTMLSTPPPTLLLGLPLTMPVIMLLLRLLPLRS